ncbi:MAG: hypothetical protein JST35_05640 [Armatimonadetes bacterium]|nr:hypothetical protein [Armatimonadota bacterium]
MSQNHKRREDIAGILLITMSLIVGFALVFPNSGFIGEFLGSAVRAMFGRAAMVAPACGLLLGTAYLLGKRSWGLTHLAWGLGLLFLTIVGFLSREREGNFFDYSLVPNAGGYVGAIVGFIFDKLLADARNIGLGALGMIGVVLCVDTPIRHWGEQVRNRAKKVQSSLTRKPKGREVPTRAIVETSSDDVRRMEPLTRGLQTQEVVPERKTLSRRAPIITESEPVTKSTPPLVQQTTKEGYELPPLALLNSPVEKPKRSQAEMQRNIETLEGTLEQFGIDANVVEIANGPTVTRYEIQLGPGIRVAKIVSLADNIAMDLAASQVRVEAPIPGKAAIGVEVPNTKPVPVNLREVCDSKDFINNPSKLTFALGQDVAGTNRYADLTRMPHLLIAGATNSGKSIGLASLITSLLMRNSPKDLRFVMIDPKRVELTLFDGIPHLLCPVIKDVKEAPGVLRAVCREMDRRYDLLSDKGCRNIDGWNEKATYQDRLPYIVVIVDELADLMIAARADVETAIVRLAQLARAVGIHLVIATQRPSADVITGLIKTNIPSRAAFAVSSQIDSRIILDEKGAEDLIGRGDMLFLPIDASKPLRIQGCYVSEKEIDAICKFWREQESANYTLQPINAEEPHDGAKERGDFAGESDPLFEEVVRWVVDRGQASTSMIQRKFSIGFQRASRLLDNMEERGVVGPRDGPRPREVLIGHGEIDTVMGRANRYREEEMGFIGDD